MIYPQVVEGVFLRRPNRFIAHVEIEGKEEVCHVKNTGRCRELLIPGCRVYLAKAQNKNRRTGFDLIAVWKGERLINMDSAAPNQVFREWAPSSGLFGENPYIRPETTHGDSRFDFYIEGGEKPTFVEVKGCTLESEGQVYFPDAPTQRGVKHLEGLIRCKEEGYDAMAVFVVQMENVLSFSPNDVTHPAFGQALRKAQAKGVQLLALSCHVEPDKLEIAAPVPIVL